MKSPLGIPLWTMITPIVGLLLLMATPLFHTPLYTILPGLVLIGTVLAAVHHAEMIAHRTGEPYGTLILAVAVTIIEVSLILSLMLAGGPGAETLARDTVFAAVMIILTGLVGLCLLVGGFRHREQHFELLGANAALISLTAITILTLVLPNYTTTVPGPAYSHPQLVFVALISLVLYGTFVAVQTVRHRAYFLTDETDETEAHATNKPGAAALLVALLLLLAGLTAVVLLAKKLAPTIESGVIGMGAPKSLVGVIVAAVILLPEGLAAVKAARKNQLQTSLNLALGSALASIGLTIPAVAFASMAVGLEVTLGLDAKSMVLLVLSLFTVSLSLATGRTTILQGMVLLVLFAVYLFTTIFP